MRRVVAARHRLVDFFPRPSASFGSPPLPPTLPNHSRLYIPITLKHDRGRRDARRALRRPPWYARICFLLFGVKVAGLEGEKNSKENSPFLFFDSFKKYFSKGLEAAQESTRQRSTEEAKEIANKCVAFFHHFSPFFSISRFSPFFFALSLILTPSHPHTSPESQGRRHASREVWRRAPHRREGRGGQVKSESSFCFLRSLRILFFCR